MKDFTIFIMSITLAGLVMTPFFWYVFYEPNRIIDEVKDKLSIVEPYDVYDRCYAMPVSYGWWDVVIYTMDVDYGIKTSDAVRYNSDTKVIIPYGKLIGIEIK